MRIKKSDLVEIKDVVDEALGYLVNSLGFEDDDATEYIMTLTDRLRIAYDILDKVTEEQ